MSETAHFEVSRRAVLAGGAASVGISAIPSVAEGAAPMTDQPPKMAVTFKINGKAQALMLDTRTTWAPRKVATTASAEPVPSSSTARASIRASALRSCMKATR